MTTRFCRSIVVHGGTLLFMCLTGSADAAGITVFDSEAAFLDAAPIESTETFDDLPTSTHYDAPTIELDGVRYTVRRPSDCLEVDPAQTFCWSISYGGPITLPPWGNPWPAASDPNILLSNSIDEDILTFGAGMSVKAIGFYFTTPAQLDPGVPPYREGFTGWEILVTDNLGFTLTVDVVPPTELGPDPQARPYFGFLADGRITQVSVRDKSDDIYGVNWGFDNVSRSATVVPLPAAGCLLGSSLGLLGWVRRRVALIRIAA